MDRESLPECAVAKLAELSQLHDEAAGKFQAILKRRKDQAMIVAELSTRLDQHDPGDAAYRGLRNKLKIAQSELERLVKAQESRDRERRSAFAVFNRVDEWVTATSAKLHKARSVSPVTYNSKRSLEATRHEIDAAASELQRVRTAPPTTPSLERDVAAYVESLRARCQVSVQEPQAAVMRGHYVVQPLQAFKVNFAVSLEPSPYDDPVIQKALCLQALLDPEGLTAKLLAAIPETSEPGIDASKKGGMLAELSAKLLAAERREEALIVAALAEGIAIERRPDADPRAVLGVEVVTVALEVLEGGSADAAA